MFPFHIDLQSINIISVIVRIFLAVLLGGILGMERESKNHPAGFRTYSLVCLGSAVVMMTNQYVVTSFGTGDPARLGAQVISGIGFLGAGTIIVTSHNRVRGLTTAAGLWAAACMGLAIGIGFYSGAICAAIGIMVVMILLYKVDAKIMTRSKVMRLYTIFDNVDGFEQFNNVCAQKELTIHDLNITKNKRNKDSDNMVAVFTVKSRKNFSHVEIIRELSDIETLKYIEELH